MKNAGLLPCPFVLVRPLTVAALPVPATLPGCRLPGLCGKPSEGGRDPPFAPTPCVTE
jgi:hypothetical protein